MATHTTAALSEHLHAIVDMGSNGIRFSISTLQPPTARIVPTLYQSRAAISLYDAQYSASGERQPINDATITAVCSAFKSFRRTCTDFVVPHANVTVLATEATRTASNSQHFRDAIKQAVGWDVEMLAKQDEGKIGAMGIASSLPDISGLVMDLGGGSTQLSWLIKEAPDPTVHMPEQGAVSMPYGAAAMIRRLAQAEREGKTKALKHELQDAVKGAYASLGVPAELRKAAKRAGGFTLYLSGGGFRGWGYMLMSQHAVQPYPIPAINGFRASRRQFLSTQPIKEAAVNALEDEDEQIFRVSDRRAGQVPAVAFLVNALAEALPEINEVRFCQGGVREGYLFTKLSPEVRGEHPLVVATEPFDTSNTSGAITKLLLSALPPGNGPAAASDTYRQVFTKDLLDAFANMIYYHSSHSKDLQSSAALRSTTSGILAGVHGVLHENRAMLALLLCQRWGGDVPPTDHAFKHALQALIESKWTLWWIKYLGAVASLIASVFPAGPTSANAGRVTLVALWNHSGSGAPQVDLRFVFADAADARDFGDQLHKIEKVGKKKKWIGGRDGAGYKVAVEVNGGHLDSLNGVGST
ncbi:retrograde regulation protein 2 [Teratosphaeriaceae sp. CCFEE 6253]|nr:retrograde regulation protein 2 [Teratosphaeriaceae sp. CCFEE 6253]